MYSIKISVLLKGQSDFVTYEIPLNEECVTREDAKKNAEKTTDLFMKDTGFLTLKDIDKKLICFKMNNIIISKLWCCETVNKGGLKI
jgi:hypothetical protein